MQNRFTLLLGALMERTHGDLRTRRTSPDLPPDGRYWIAETAVVIGRVRLKQDASIWWGSVLRGDNEWIDLGPRSNIQECCTLHTDMGFALASRADCTVGHPVVLTGRPVADG